jgi:hypothetical protein
LQSAVPPRAILVGAILRRGPEVPCPG